MHKKKTTKIEKHKTMMQQQSFSLNKNKKNLNIYSNFYLTQTKHEIYKIYIL